LTQVAARLILSKTSAGFHPFSVGVQTYAFLSWEQVTIRLVWGAQEIAVMSLSCCLSASLDQVLTSANAWTKLQPSWLLLYLCRMSAGLPDKHEQIGHTSTVWPERNSSERSEGQLMGFWLGHDVCYEMGQVERTLAVYYSVI
jgi:hypothetical protein